MMKLSKEIINKNKKYFIFQNYFLIKVLAIKQNKYA